MGVTFDAEVFFIGVFSLFFDILQTELPLINKPWALLDNKLT